MKIAVIIALTFVLAGCATNQSSALHDQASVRATDESKHPELAGLTKEQIARLFWRIE